MRDLYRRRRRLHKSQELAHEKREVTAKNLLGNLSRTKEHPTLNTVLEVAEIFSLTLDGAHRLFGYDLARIGEYDKILNAGRTHIIESYPFRRDQLVDLPSQLADAEAFSRNALLRELVQSWQTEVPIRELEEQGWHTPGAYYVRVGTEDSLDSSLPPGSIGLVEPVTQDETNRPNPRSLYLLQFGNGYRCSRCVLSRGKLILLSPARSYRGVQEFRYPGTVRIAGRLRAFAVDLPTLENRSLRSLPVQAQSAPLILPWEHRDLDRLLATGHTRLRRTKEGAGRVRDLLETVFKTRLSERTERRYRHPTSSQPHIDTLIQLTLANMARYTDVLRVSGAFPTDAARYSLETLLNAQSWKDLETIVPRSRIPSPNMVWEERRREFLEWPALFSARVPQLKSWDNRVVRLAAGGVIPGLTPPLTPGTLMVLDAVQDEPEVSKKQQGWARPLYALQRGAEFFCGYIEREGARFGLVGQRGEAITTVPFEMRELRSLKRLVAVSVPV